MQMQVQVIFRYSNANAKIHKITQYYKYGNKSVQYMVYNSLIPNLNAALYNIPTRFDTLHCSTWMWCSHDLVSSVTTPRFLTFTTSVLSINILISA